MPMWAAFALIVCGLGGACLVVILGIPLNYLIFFIIKKCGKTYPLWLKHVVSLCLPLILAPIWYRVISDVIINAGYYAKSYNLEGVEIPVKVISVEYPPESMVGDDYQEIRHFEIRDGGLSPEVISQLETLCLCDTSKWRKNGTKYVYSESPMYYEYRLIVTIDSATNTGVFDYYKF